MTPKVLLLVLGAVVIGITAQITLSGNAARAQEPAATCSHEGQTYLAGDRLCIAGQVNICNQTGQWVATDEACQ